MNFINYCTYLILSAWVASREFANDWMSPWPRNCWTYLKNRESRKCWDLFRRKAFCNFGQNGFKILHKCEHNWLLAQFLKWNNIMSKLDMKSHNDYHAKIQQYSSMLFLSKNMFVKVQGIFASWFIKNQPNTKYKWNEYKIIFKEWSLRILKSLDGHLVIFSKSLFF